MGNAERGIKRKKDEFTVQWSPYGPTKLKKDNGYAVVWNMEHCFVFNSNSLLDVKTRNDIVNMRWNMKQAPHVALQNIHKRGGVAKQLAAINRKKLSLPVLTESLTPLRLKSEVLMREYNEAIELIARERKIAQAPRKSNPIEILPDMPMYRADPTRCSLRHKYPKIVSLTDVHYAELLHAVHQSWVEMKEALDDFNSSLAETLEAAREAENDDGVVETPLLNLMGGDLDAGVAVIESEEEVEEFEEEEDTAETIRIDAIPVMEKATPGTTCSGNTHDRQSGEISPMRQPFPEVNVQVVLEEPRSRSGATGPTAGRSRNPP
ncbi:hypothetical protein CYMTET_54550 [Cymbomonas tetramitiformis]|uniref:Uncharacterized protein n=1 Tax=Cymbomonas tetramitiformis TaxID=36881 RepID=A0AAE0ENL3_9CHLO|nr:hypothetical protein CYMTET_54550 [Cymbomonas tetramitiformis]